MKIVGVIEHAENARETVDKDIDDVKKIAQEGENEGQKKSKASKSKVK